MSKYWKVIESVSGWRVYHIPATVCPTEDDALHLVEDCDAYNFIVDEGDDNYQIESTEFKEESDEYPLHPTMATA